MMAWPTFNVFWQLVCDSVKLLHKRPERKVGRRGCLMIGGSVRNNFLYLVACICITEKNHQNKRKTLEIFNLLVTFHFALYRCEPSGHKAHRAVNKSAGNQFQGFHFKKNVRQRCTLSKLQSVLRVTPKWLHGLRCESQLEKVRVINLSR